MTIVRTECSCVAPGLSRAPVQPVLLPSVCTYNGETSAQTHLMLWLVLRT